jgi:hypothetical protein
MSEKWVHASHNSIKPYSKVFPGRNGVLVYSPVMWKDRAEAAAAHCRASFPGFKKVDLLGLPREMGI